MASTIVNEGAPASTTEHPQSVQSTAAAPAGARAVGAQQLPEGERVDVALEAAWELEQLARGMLEAMRDCEPAGLRYRPQAVRVLHLSQLLMGALGDELEKLPDLWARLTGLDHAR